MTDDAHLSDDQLLTSAIQKINEIYRTSILASVAMLRETVTEEIGAVFDGYDGHGRGVSEGYLMALDAVDDILAAVKV